MQYYTPLQTQILYQGKLYDTAYELRETFEEDDRYSTHLLTLSLNGRNVMVETPYIDREAIECLLYDHHLGDPDKLPFRRPSEPWQDGPVPGKIQTKEGK